MTLRTTLMTLAIAPTLAVLVGTIAFAGDKPSSAGATPDEVAQCKTMCEMRDNISCKNGPSEAACNATCLTFVKESAGTCHEKFDAVLAMQASNKWRCDDYGQPRMVQPPTGNEYYMCASKKGAPVKHTVCGVSANGPYCDSCLSAECAQSALACGANKECRAIEACIGNCPRSDEAPACIDKCQSKHAAGVDTFKAINSCAIAMCESQCWSEAPKTMGKAPDGTSMGFMPLTECTLITP